MSRAHQRRCKAATAALGSLAVPIGSLERYAELDDEHTLREHAFLVVRGSAGTAHAKSCVRLVGVGFGKFLGKRPDRDTHQGSFQVVWHYDASLELRIVHAKDTPEATAAAKKWADALSLIHI